MSTLLAITNQKGGVGKTTTAVNLAASLAAIQRRVLLIDLDPQGNATMGLGVRVAQGQTLLADVLLGEATIEQALVHSTFKVDLLPTGRDLTLAEVRMLRMEHREYRLRNALAPIRDQYDFILIDCPPALNILTVNALIAADAVIIPVQCEYYALEGLVALMSTIDQLRQSANPQLHIEGLLRTMFDGRNRLTMEVSEQLISHFGDKVYQTVIPRNVRLAEAPSHGLPALQYDKRSQGAVAYLALAAEIVRRQQARQAAQHGESMAVGG